MILREYRLQLAELSLEFYQGTKEQPETAKFVDEKKSEIEGSDALTLYDFCKFLRLLKKITTLLNQIN